MSYPYALKPCRTCEELFQPRSGSHFFCAECKAKRPRYTDPDARRAVDRRNQLACSRRKRARRIAAGWVPTYKCSLCRKAGHNYTTCPLNTRDSL